MAGAATIGALRVVLGADTAALDRGLKDSQQKLSGFGSAVGLSMAAVAAAVVAAAVAMGVAIKGVIDHADKLNSLSQSTGVTVEALSKLQYAATLSGVSAESLGGSLLQLSKTMNVAATDGASNAASAFTALGVSIKNQDGTLRSSADVLSDVAGKFAGYKDGAEKTALAVALFGSAGANLIPMLNRGKDGLKEVGDEAEKFGLVLDSKTTAAAAAFNENLIKMDAIKRGLVTTIAAKLLPVLEQLSAAWLDTKTSGHMMNDIAEFMVGIIKELVVEITQAVIFVQRLSAEIAAVAKVLKNPDWLNLGDTLAKGWAAFNEEGKKTQEIFAVMKATSNAIISNQPTWGGQISDIKLMQGEVTRLGAEWTKTAAPIFGVKEATENALQTFLSSQAKRTAATIADAQTVGLSADAHEKLKVTLQAESIAKEKGIVITDALRASITATALAAAAAQQTLQGAQLTQEMLLPWDLRNQKLTQYNALLQAGVISHDTFSAAAARVQFPAFSAASIAATDFGMQVDQLATGAVNSLSSNLAGLIAGTKTAAEAFKAFATSIIADLAAMIIKLLIYKALRMAIMGFSDGGAVSMLGFSTGGMFATGGNVAGPGTGTSDSIPAMLSNGEFVVNASATKQFAPLLNAINSGKLPSFSDGGGVSGQPQAIPSAPSISKTVVLQGVMWGRDQMRDLFAALNEGMRDGHKLNVQFA